jgi:hypothetical protein
MPGVMQMHHHGSHMHANHMVPSGGPAWAPAVAGGALPPDFVPMQAEFEDKAYDILSFPAGLIPKLVKNSLKCVQPLPHHMGDTHLEPFCMMDRRALAATLCRPTCSPCCWK